MAMPKHTKSTSGFLKDLSSEGQLLMAFVLFCLFLGLSSYMSDIFSQFFFGRAISFDLKKINKQDLAQMRILQMTATIFTFLLPALFFGFLKTKRPFAYFKNILSIDLKWFFIAPILLASIYPFLTVLATINSEIHLPAAFSDLEKELLALEQMATDYAIAFLNDRHWDVFLINLLMISVLPAICEEFLFRGVFQRLALKTFESFHVAIFLSAFFFAFIHFEFFSFLPRLALGLLLGYLYYYSQSLILPIFTHFINNASVIIVSYYMVLKHQKLSSESEVFPFYIVIPSTILFCVVFYFFILLIEKHQKKNRLVL